MSKKEVIKFSISKCEQDFIQLMFCDNRMLLGYKYKELYKAMLDMYRDVWDKGRNHGVDLMMINKVFKANL